MTWADFYLVCFVVGFFLSVVIFLLGGARLSLPHFHLHLPGLHPHAVSHGARLTAGAQVSPFNLITLTAFPGLVRGHGIFARPAFHHVVLCGAGGFSAERHRRRSHHLFVRGTCVEFAQ